VDHRSVVAVPAGPTLFATAGSTLAVCAPMTRWCPIANCTRLSIR
jgi:hypothetical protein